MTASGAINQPILTHSQGITLGYDTGNMELDGDTLKPYDRVMSISTATSGSGDVNSPGSVPSGYSAVDSGSITGLGLNQDPVHMALVRFETDMRLTMEMVSEHWTGTYAQNGFFVNADEHLNFDIGFNAPESGYGNVFGAGESNWHTIAQVAARLTSDQEALGFWSSNIPWYLIVAPNTTNATVTWRVTHRQGTTGKASAIGLTGFTLRAYSYPVDATQNGVV